MTIETFSARGVRLGGEGDKKQGERTEKRRGIEICEFETEDLSERKHQGATEKIILDNGCRRG